MKPSKITKKPLPLHLSSRFMKNYCQSITSYSRFKTIEVKVGNITIGGDSPIVPQSMTTSDTMDTKNVVDECIRIIESGGELVRLTTPSIKEAEHLELIKQELLDRGYNTPLVADVHFTPNAAEIAALKVEKVRINPGNYAEKKIKSGGEYTDTEYNDALQKIKLRFSPLIHLCKTHKRALRIGTNHGSLSDRILSRYGDTPRGMVESAMEFIRFCAEENFHNIIISMKASNPLIMVQAYRLLVATMIEEGFNYPLHLGVTEAGDGEDGRIKSAIGIGALLEDGLGDTIRVSLTEPAEHEIPVAKKIIDRYKNRNTGNDSTHELFYNPYEYNKRQTLNINNIGSSHVPVVIHDLSSREQIKEASFFPFGYRYLVAEDKWEISDSACDYIYVGKLSVPFEIPGTLAVIQDFDTWQKDGTSKMHHYPLVKLNDLDLLTNTLSSSCFFISINHTELGLLQTVSAHPFYDRFIIVFAPDDRGAVFSSRALFAEMSALNLKSPVIIYNKQATTDPEVFQINSAIDTGTLLLDGFGDGIMLEAEKIGSQQLNSTAFGILQATRTRISKTEYISCPSCGRTLFNLQETTAQIKAQTQHLKGIKIGIMGCIVNGPGEMADADYGYVGSGVGKINLYKSKEIIKRNVPTEHAVEELINLIKDGGDWVDPISVS